jgi:hypothetical protein
MISECSNGHICFGKGDLSSCAMKDCGRLTIIISPIDIKWFYKINESGLASLELVLDQNKNLSILGSVILGIMLDIILERLQYNIFRQVEHEDEEVPENDDLVEEDYEVDIDDEFEDIEEDFDENNQSGF